MFYMIEYSVRTSGLPDKDVFANSAALLAAFARWKPPAGVTILTHVMKLGCNGGWIFAKADDPKLIAGSVSPFTFWDAIEVHPVLDITDAIPIAQASLTWAQGK